MNKKQELMGYKKLSESSFKDIMPGDRIKYSVNEDLRTGGVVKINKYPKYLVLMNPIKNVTWCVQMTEPSLKIYIKTLKQIQKESKEKEKVYKLFKEGFLQKIRN
jgi:hypothetical protein